MSKTTWLLLSELVTHHDISINVLRLSNTSFSTGSPAIIMKCDLSFKGFNIYMSVLIACFRKSTHFHIVKNLIISNKHTPTIEYFPSPFMEGHIISIQTNRSLIRYIDKVVIMKEIWKFLNTNIFEWMPKSQVLCAL